ncbi:sorbosone dehydrogenase family protein [Nocardioides sp. R-C-SC26]|uniref:PQQ-dependent sugar dehydrogenase n=1 Tax=Nocardioides sp. R-C-SC26 TaxID=2870414 RepID=UPI001E2857B0|nr:PQQ-dependent sugar dehydrogenase [Nocardioides sp. R-C-SC26]
MRRTVRPPARARAKVTVAVAWALGATATLAGCGSDDPRPPGVTATPTTPDTPAGSAPPSTDGSSGSDGPGAAAAQPGRARAIVTGLAAPWGVAFLPDGDALVTERDTRRVLLISGPAHRVREIGVIDDAAPEGEGGLLGVAISPDFERDRAVFLYLTTSSDNRIVRARLQNGRLGAPETILDGIPRGFTHDGGRLEFGPDGSLFASTGESGEPELSQDRDSLGGKILRITTDGDAAPGNPFDSPVWSWGHRNVQGLAFDDDGRLWASEFGSTEFDELNRIERGANYGWPRVEGEGGRNAGPEFTDPQVTWPVDEASPSGLAFAGGALWMAGLRGERLWRVTLDGAEASDPTAFLVGEYGRLRTVVQAPDGALWVTTSNRDGRGDPGADDDQILRIPLR